MALISDLTGIGARVRDDLQSKSDDGAFSGDHRALFRADHRVLARLLMALEPAPFGQQSPRYDGPLAALRQAEDALGECSADDVASIQRARTQVGAANRELEQITRPAGTARMAGGLSIRRPMRAVPAAPATARSFEAGARSMTALGADDGTEPGGEDGTDDGQPEPYLSSLAKLFPAESLSALLLVLAIAEQYWTLRIALIVLIAAFSGLLRSRAMRNPVTGGPDLLSVGVSVISFLIYAAALLGFGVLFGTDAETTRLVMTIVAIMWMAVIADVVRKTPVS